MSMLDQLAAAGSPAPPASMMASNRALRSARDAVDGHHVWELDPESIVDDRLADRLDPEDVLDLRDAIEANGQTVPILVRRHPKDSSRYLLVYGRRRLEAIRQSQTVTKVRALVASLDDDTALRSQISENMARRDLSYIEKALFAQRLVESGFGTQKEVSEVLTVSKSSVSMAIGVIETVGSDLAIAIGPAHGVGRPRWEALAKALEHSTMDRDALVRIAEDVHVNADVALIEDGDRPLPDVDVSVLAFEAVVEAVGKPTSLPPEAPKPRKKKAPARPLTASGLRVGSLRRSARGVSIDIEEKAFADWIEAEAEELIKDLHARWSQRSED